MTLFPILAAKDLEGVLAFYSDVLGVQILSRDPFGAMLRSGDITFRIGADPNFEPVGRSVLGWLVDDIAAKNAELAAKGVEFQSYDMLEQNDAGVWATPDGGAQVCWFLDPAGNVLSLTQVTR